MSQLWASLAISILIWHHITLIPPLYYLLTCHFSKMCHMDSKCIPFWESQTYSDHFFTPRTNFLSFRSNSIMFITKGGNKMTVTLLSWWSSSFPTCLRYSTWANSHIFRKIWHIIWPTKKGVRSLSHDLWQ